MEPVTCRRSLPIRVNRQSMHNGTHRTQDRACFHTVTLLSSLWLLSVLTGCSDHTAPPATQTTEPTPKKPVAEAPSDELVKDVIEAWAILYEEQRKSRSWPTELGKNFATLMDQAGPDGELPLSIRELYQTRIRQYFPKLCELADIRLPAAFDTTGQPKKDSQGNLIKANPFSQSSRRLSYRSYGSGSDVPSLGMVDWDLLCLHQFERGHFRHTPPTSSEIRLAQEDIWAYESILEAIGRTNSGATDRYEVPIKTIAVLDVGKAAAPSFLDNATFPDSRSTDTGYRDDDESSNDDYESFGDSHESSEEGAVGHALDARYVDSEGKPVRVDGDALPSAPARMLPVHLQVIIDQRQIASLLANLASAPMPIEVCKVTLCPADNTPDYTGHAAYQADEKHGRAYAGGMFGSGGYLSNDLNKTTMPETLHSVSLEVHALAHIYLPPPQASDLEGLLPGASAQEVIDLADQLVRAVRNRVRWLELLTFVNACLPTDDQAERLDSAEGITKRSELHITGIRCAPAGTESGPGNNACEIHLFGHHFHNAVSDGTQVSLGTQFVRDTLFDSFHTQSVLLPSLGNAEITERVAADTLGIAEQTMLNEGAVQNVTVRDPGAPMKEATEIGLRRFDFHVRFRWQADARNTATSAMSFEELARQTAVPVESKHYSFAVPWDPPLFMQRPKRSAPRLLAMESLRGKGGRDAVIPAMSGGYSSAGVSQGLRWIVLTGLLPFEKQAEAYRTAYRNAQDWNATRDCPRYATYRIRRAEVSRNSANLEQRWQELNLARAFPKSRTFLTEACPVPPQYTPDGSSYGGYGGYSGSYDQDYGEMGSGSYRGYSSGPPSSDEVNRVFPWISPVPRRHKPDWGAELCHLPEIPLYENSPPARARRTENEAPPMPSYRLFRFFDFDVKSGGEYRYQVKLLLHNPNYRLEARLLTDKKLAEQPYLETEWCEASAGICVPYDSGVLTGPVTESSSPVEEPMVNLVACSFDFNTGKTISSDIAAYRGQLVNFEATANQDKPKTAKQPTQLELMDPYGLEGDLFESPRPPRRKVQKSPPEEHSYETNMLVVDIMGGEPIHAAAPETIEPGSVLLLDPAGRLVVRNELDDRADYAIYCEPESPKPARNPQPRSGPDGLFFDAEF